MGWGGQKVIKIRAQKTYCGGVCVCGGYVVFYRKCWVRVVALGVSSLGMGFGVSGGYILN